MLLALLLVGLRDGATHDCYACEQAENSDRKFHVVSPLVSIRQATSTPGRILSAVCAAFPDRCYVPRGRIPARLRKLEEELRPGAGLSCVACSLQSSEPAARCASTARPRYWRRAG